MRHCSFSGRRGENVASCGARGSTRGKRRRGSCQKLARLESSREIGVVDATDPAGVVFHDIQVSPGIGSETAQMRGRVRDEVLRLIMPAQMRGGDIVNGA